MSTSLSVSQNLKLDDQPADYLRRATIAALECYPFVVYNKLPVTVTVIHERVNVFINTLGTIPPKGKLTTEQSKVASQDLLHFVSAGVSTVQNGSTSNTTSPSYIVCPSVIVRKQVGNVSVGGTVATQNGYNRDKHPNGDISSVRIHNMLPWSVLVYHNGKLVGYVDKNPNLDTKNHGNMTIAPHIYYDNKNMGIKLGDQFQLKIAPQDSEAIFGVDITNNSVGTTTFVKGQPTDLYTFVVKDRNISEIFVGQPSSEVGMHMKPETYTYRLGPTDAYPREKNAKGTTYSRQHENNGNVGNTGPQSNFDRHQPIARYKTLSNRGVQKF